MKQTCKPTLKRQNGQWFCYFAGKYDKPIGHGTTPSIAYADWLRSNYPDWLRG